MPDDGYGFIPYQQVDISEYFHATKHEAIRQVIKIEQPIHFEELCRRVAPLFGNSKATVRIREEVERRFSENIVSALRSTYEKMLNNGRAKEMDGKVRIS